MFDFKKLSETKKLIKLDCRLSFADQKKITKEQIEQKVAHNLEYWFNGGTNIDFQAIRIFSLDNPKPYNDNYLGISPSMSYAKEWYTFYKPN